MKCTVDFAIERPYLVVSSLIFLTNVVMCVYRTEYLYAYLFVTLVLTSFIFHSKPNLVTNIIDKIAIIGVILYGGYIYWIRVYEGDNIWPCILPPLCFLAVFWLFLYGRVVKRYCYDCDETVATYYHGLLHVISSLGHHLILL